MRTSRLVLALFALTSLMYAVEPGLSSDAKAALDRANSEFLSGKYADASRDFAQAAKFSHDTCQHCLEGLALSKAKLGDEKESLKAADRAIAMAETPVDKASAHDCKGEICLMYASNDPKKLSDAESEFRSSADALPKSPFIQFRLGYTLLREKKNDEGVQHLQAFLLAHPTGNDAELARKFIANPALAGVELAPKFSFTTLQGTVLDNTQLEGKVVVLDFWATWCPACRESVPELKELTKKYGPDKLCVISVSADKDDARWRDFVAKKHMDWNQFRDDKGEVLKAFGIRVFPSYIILTKDGAIAKRMEGSDPHESLVYRLRNELGEVMK